MTNGHEMKGKSFTAFRSAAEEADTKRDHDAMKREERACEGESGPTGSTEGRVTEVPGAELPYVVIFAHQGSDPTEHAFATMSEAEAFIKRNTPVPRAVLSTKFDPPAPDPDESGTG